MSQQGFQELIKSNKRDTLFTIPNVNDAGNPLQYYQKIMKYQHFLKLEGRFL